MLRWEQRKFDFRYPMDPVPRTAVLEPWFRPSHGDSQVRMILPSAEWLEELQSFRPQAIVASWEQLDRLAEAASRAIVEPTHAVVVLHRQSSTPLNASDRERIWKAFRVPLFEQVIGPRGELLATECAAHDGMHIESPRFRFQGEIDRSPCACGRLTQRLRTQHPLRRLMTAAAHSGTL